MTVCHISMFNNLNSIYMKTLPCDFVNTLDFLGASSSLLDSACVYQSETDTYKTVYSDITVMGSIPPNSDPALIYEANVRGQISPNTPYPTGLSNDEIMSSIKPRSMQSLTSIKEFNEFLNQTLENRLSVDEQQAFQKLYKEKFLSLLKSKDDNSSSTDSPKDN